MKLYRAILKTDYIENHEYVGHQTKRSPSNVPYFIDNIWEYFRPSHFPSRRHAIYASPNAQSALESASSGRNRDDYIVCEIIVPQGVRVAHLSVSDAKYHQDIKVLQKAIMKLLDFNDLALEEKMQYGALFLPCVDAKEIQNNVHLVSLIEKVRHLSTFWQDSSINIDEDGLGELFFELEAGQSYQLKKMG